MRKYLTPVLALLLCAIAALEADAQEPNFGRALALTDAELFVGQPVNWYGPGVVYVYAADASGAYVERAELTASDASTKDDFGRALSVRGNTLVVGAPRKHDGSGVAYAFTRDDEGVWRQEAIIAPPETGDHSSFATTVALDGASDLFIGSPAVDSVGVVYHYRRDGGSWTLQGTHRAEDLEAPASFGGELALAGDWMVVGAPAADSAVGRVFFFRRQADGSWAEAASLSPPPALAEARSAFGASILLDGERAYIGAPGAGMVIVAALDEADTWSTVGSLHPFDGGQRTQFGISIAKVGEELWVGAPGVNRFNGRVYRFVADGADGWNSVIRFDAVGTEGATAWPFAFGYTMAGSADRAIVGMPFRDFGEGRVLVAARDGESWREAQTLEGDIYRLGGELKTGDRCEDGMLSDFPCSNIELVAHVPISELGGERGVWVNDVWGWTDPETDGDYALVARRDGASFVDVTNPSAPRLVGTLSRTEGTPPSVWRDIKVIGNYAFIVSDGAGPHGMQVFDLTRLRDVGGEAIAFTPDATYHEIHSAHNVVADTASGFLYIVGANGGGETCGGGLHMVDARDPLNLSFAGCYNDQEGANSRGYTHDAQCLVYEGPDEEYQGRQLCIGSNEKEINIADVTDKANPVTVGRGTYPNAAYTHQGWFDEEQRYFYQNDELDEMSGSVEGTRTIVWDLAELEDPIVVNEYIGPVTSSDHNLYVKGDRVYESNYGSGLRVLDISDRANPKEIAFFDSAPLNDDGPGHSSSQSGAWSNYPFFDDGIVVFTSVREGLFIVRVAEDRPVS